MKLTLNIEGKERSFLSSKITMRQFKQGSNLLRELMAGELFGEDYPESDYDKVISFVCDRFDNQFTMDEFWDGFEIQDSTDFFTFIHRVLQDVQTNEEKQKLMNEIQRQLEAEKQQDENGTDLPPSDS